MSAAMKSFWICAALALTGCADQPVASTAQLLNAVAALKPQSEASINVQRGSQKLELEIVVAQRPKTMARRER